ncbi:ABC transporter ATP-binding protein [Devosia ginsengisoli]|uniref:sn-glycerol-3-phosphate ABC transporter ATP-binding protein UgpC n=1 Tax=Devosia ginsengisoli TaxID=400770 RepID=A0A5B8LR16_9HYPH|nr:sn-glycerol-3-phosphate ABC transporter ATP-binding protein UgpC [Devosia ginsengisoli]QDZ10667.1 sn-glycerol-3-phosphate ABC transporter ATP-binding protein UgpC [Devosia ginsengisoli]
MAELSIRALKKSYGPTEIISSISLDIVDGEFVALVGPSGCGKSTLLRMIAGLETISGGEIAIGEKVVNNVPPKDRDIAMVFQNYALYPNKTVADNIGFPLYMARVPKAERDRKVAEVMRSLDLEALAKRYPKQLSGGQRQRVAMGRAIVRNPQVFLFDEPLSNLDAKLRVSMRAEIKELHQRLKATTVYVTHDQVEAMTMADKIVVMRAGNVEQIGAPLELYDRPANKFVAGFIGSPSMNFFDGQMTEQNGALSFTTKAGLSISLDPAQRARAADAVSLGIRPEHIQLDASPSDGALAVDVAVIEPTGNEATFILRSGGDELVVVQTGRHNYRPQDTVWVRPTTESLHFFDEAGRTL